MIPAPVSAAIYKKHAAIGLNEGSNDEIQWRILSGKSRFPEHVLLLSQAAAIFRVSSFVYFLKYLLLFANICCESGLM